MSLIITKLGESRDVKCFACGNRDINRFLKRNAYHDQERKHSVTYVLTEENDDEVIAYVTIAMASIQIEDLPTTIIIDDFPYDNTSALLIARVGRYRKYRGNGYGKMMIKFAISIADRMSEKVGCRFVYLDSYLDKIDLYKELGFVECAEKEQEEDGKRYYVTMCYDLLG